MGKFRCLAIYVESVTLMKLSCFPSCFTERDPAAYAQPEWLLRKRKVDFDESSGWHEKWPTRGQHAICAVFTSPSITLHAGCLSDTGMYRLSPPLGELMRGVDCRSVRTPGGCGSELNTWPAAPTRDSMTLLFSSSICEASFFAMRFMFLLISDRVCFQGEAI